MYLKSLEIQGFKSFPDRISLKFDKGLTAVVGPNGSGKSNIGDSVRWVLGEQSIKALRGNKMEDVIFSGTVSRKPVGFASVTLNIDNSDGTVADIGDEVSVTRKLFRSGESEYSVNGKPCRLKDITELFMDTGLGRDGYAIIGQGRIAEIISAKSSDRRDIFEEASGISGFRYKKSEAERKLNSAQENILRLADIISELKGRVGPLKIQAEQAEKFIELAQQRKRIEVSLWVKKLGEIKLSVTELDSEKVRAEKNYSDNQSEIEVQEERLQKSVREMQECTVRSDMIRKKMIEREREFSEKKSLIAVYGNDIEHCRTAVENSEKGIEENRRTLEEISAQRDSIKNKLTELAERRDGIETETESVREELGGADLENMSAGQLADGERENINKLNMKKSSLEAVLESAERTVRDEKERLKALRESDSDNRKAVEVYRSKIEENRAFCEKNTVETAGISEKLSDRERACAEAGEKFESSKSELENAIYTLRDREQRRKILSDLENNMEGFSGSVKQIMKAAAKGILGGVCGTVAQNISVSAKLALAIETALGGAMQNIITQDENSAKECIRFLKDRRAGRATFLPITSVRGNVLNETGIENCRGFVDFADRAVDTQQAYRGIISHLLSRTVIAENIDFASEIAKKYRYRFRIVTLDGQVVNAGGSYTGGSAQRTGGAITRRGDMARLDGEIEKLRQDCRRLESETDALRVNYSGLRAETERLKSEITRLEAERVRNDAEYKSLMSLMEQAEQQTENSVKMMNSSDERIQKAQRDIVSSKEELVRTEKLLAESEKRLSDIQQERERLRLKRGELSEKLSELRVKYTELQKDTETQNAELVRIDEREKQILSGTERLKAEIAEKKSESERKRVETERLKKELESADTETEKSLSEIRRLQDMHTEQNRLVNEIQSGLKALNYAGEKFSAEIVRIDEKKEKLCRESDSIIDQLFEVYNLTRSEAFEVSEDIDDELSAREKLTEIKNKIKSLGNVNVNAVEEYREVSERYEFMNGQLQDVKKSKAELEDIISQLTEDMKRMFKESFRIVNENFGRIFSELFGGGSAELVLTEPENVLESGIEIRVAPPGKVIKNLISLSGGEQAFVAIAIYFAILKLRPAPFCILDEVDSALDEANVRKYAQYLKKFTDTTQFVLVTHRRGAMEEANVLYGVTMQEDGVSKLLRMEQSDIKG